MMGYPALTFWQTMRLTVLLIFMLNVCANGQEPPSKKEKKAGVEKPKEEIVQEQYYLPKEVVVIGAGIAGLAAARRLSEDRTNFTVKVFEARRDRYGGRVWTDKLTNMKARGAEVDLGGSAFNVISKNNPLIELAESFDLKIASIDNLQFIVPWLKRSYSGDQLSEITQEAAKILGQAVNESRYEKLEVSVKEAIDKVIAKGEITNSDSVGAHLVRCLPSYIIDNYSTRNYKPEVLDVGYDKVLLDGMGELIDRLVSGSPEEPPLHLSLNKAVRQIKVDKDKRKVLVRFRDGSQVAADFVVVAVPSSVIASKELLFEPELPKKYRLASEEITMSAGDRVIVEFEHAFWPAEFGVFARAVKTETERGNLQTWINVNHLVDCPALIGLLLGQAAADFEKLSVEEAEDLIINVLNEMFGEDLVRQGGKLVRFQHSKWVTDPLSMGASTYPKVGSNPDLWDTFAMPLCPYIYFAGEYTSFDNHGTLHGAYNSGVRAGDQILTGLCEILRKEKERKKEEERKKRAEAKKNKTGDAVSDDKWEGEEEDDDVGGIIEDDNDDDDEVDDDVKKRTEEAKDEL